MKMANDKCISKPQVAPISGDVGDKFTVGTIPAGTVVTRGLVEQMVADFVRIQHAALSRSEKSS